MTEVAALEHAVVVYREMLQVAMALLAERHLEIARLQEQRAAAREEMRRYVRAVVEA